MTKKIVGKLWKKSFILELEPYLKSKVLFQNILICPLQCDNENPQQDSQDHLHFCSKLHPVGLPQHLNIEDSCADIVSQEII